MQVLGTTKLNLLRAFQFVNGRGHPDLLRDVLCSVCESKRQATYPEFSGCLGFFGLRCRGD